MARLSPSLPEPVGKKVKGIFLLRRLGHLGWQDLREKVARAAKLSRVGFKFKSWAFHLPAV